MSGSPITWHDDITINGEPYLTRHPAPATGDTKTELLSDLPNNQRQYLTAIHEAAHAVAGLGAHGYIHHAQITPVTEVIAEPATNHGIPGGNVFSCNLHDGQAFAVFLGAGERAEDRWLRQNNLWTPRRAYGIELGAYSDRRCFLATNPHFGFGTDHNDYRVVHDYADQMVAQRWDAITAVADVLATRLHLTGDEIADLAQLPNGTHSMTCTGTPAA
ncbi:hypothetical protein [Streptomyces scopuliridis]|uniref:hypothetical protein n=1 Tax=Streptomyces scopuliridis TaxID=452529 RepID=UPI003442D627